MKLQHNMRQAIRNDVRDIARRAYVAMECDKDLSCQRAKDDIKDQYNSIFVTILLGVLIKLAIEFIVYWIENNIQQPTLAHRSGEPDLPIEDYV